MHECTKYGKGERMKKIHECKVCNKRIHFEDSPTYDVDEETGDKYCDECGVLVNNIKNRY